MKHIRDKQDRKLKILLKNSRNLRNREDLDEILNDICADNEIIEGNDITLQWLGGEKSPNRSLIINAGAAKANEILRQGRIYIDLEAYPVEILRPRGLRCMKCLRFHNTTASQCHGKRACRYCGDDHDSLNCSKKDHSEHYHCTTCAHYQWTDETTRRPTDLKHEALDRNCPAAKSEAEKEMVEIKKILMNSLTEDA